MLRFLPCFLQLRAQDQIMRGHWQWPDCCWLEGQWHQSYPTSPPVHTELFGTFTFHRENIDCGVVVNLEAHSCVHLHRQRDIYEYNQIAISLKLRFEEGG